MDLEQFKSVVQDVYGDATDREMSQWANYLRNYYGPDFNEVAAKAYLERKAKREDRRSVIRNQDAREDLADEFETRVAKYLGAYVEVTPNDEQSIRALVAVEIQLDNIRRQIAVGATSPEGLKDLVDIQTKLTGEHRQLQRTLGIDRRTRDEESGGSDVVGKVTESIEQAAEFYRERIVELECCGIKMGHVLMHFESWHIEAVCPRCGKTVSRSHEDVKVSPIRPIEIVSRSNSNGSGRTN